MAKISTHNYCISDKVYQLITSAALAVATISHQHSSSWVVPSLGLIKPSGKRACNCQYRNVDGKVGLSDIIDSTIITILSYYHEHDCFLSTIAIIIHSTCMRSYLYKVHASINCSCLVVYNTTTSVGNGY